MTPTAPTIGLLVSARVFEEFFGRLGITREAYVATYDNDWITYYSRFLSRAGFRMRWYLFSTDVRGTERHVHVPTGAEVCFLPAGRLYNWWTARLPYVHHFSLHLATASLALVRELRERRPDVLYVQDYESGRFDVVSVLSARLGISVIGQYHGGHSPAYPPLRGLRRWAIRRAAYILAPNTTEHRRVCETYRLPTEQARYFPNPVPVTGPSPASPEDVVARFELPAGARYVLFLGRLDTNHKGLDVLLAAFRVLSPRFPDLHLVIAGMGPDRQTLETSARDLPRVHFLGWVASRADIGALLSTAAVVACPSRFEAFCYAAAEAMVARRPVVASDVGGLRDLVVDGHTGYLVAPEDVTALADALAKVLDDPRGAEAMGRAARERIEREFSEAVLVPRLAAMLGSAAARSRP